MFATTFVDEATGKHLPGGDQVDFTTLVVDGGHAAIRRCAAGVELAPIDARLFSAALTGTEFNGIPSRARGFARFVARGITGLQDAATHTLPVLAFKISIAVPINNTVVGIMEEISCHYRMQAAANGDLLLPEGARLRRGYLHPAFADRVLLARPGAGG